MQQQSRPLQAMPDGGPIGLERIIGAIPVVLESRLPTGVEVLRNAPRFRLRKLQRYPASDSKSTLPQSMITNNICGGQQRFDRVHIGVDATVVGELSEATVPRIDVHSGFNVEEPLVPDPERLGEQITGAGQAGNNTRGRGQHYESVGITRFLIGILALFVDAGNPSTIRTVPEPSGQPVER